MAILAATRSVPLILVEAVEFESAVEQLRGRPEASDG
jgi:hypothetical protein